MTFPVSGSSMQKSPSRLVSVLKRILFRPTTKSRRLQRVWSMAHTLSLFGMNYGGGGLIEESGEIWALQNVIKPALAAVDSPIVFDVGANIGEYSLLVKRELPAAKVFAFEPALATYQELSKTLAQSDGRADLRACNFGFSDTERELELFSYTVEGNEVSLLASIDRRLPTQAVRVEVEHSENIQVRTVDGFCAAEDIQRIDLLKLDVEGHELAVLRGARTMLDRGAIQIIQFEFGPANIYSRTFFYDFWTLLAGQFDIFRIVANGIAPITYYGEHREVFLTTNYLALRKQS
jgi:FkbM family methyltransferase